MTEYNRKDGINRIHQYPKTMETYLNRLRNRKDNNAKKILELHNENVINGLAEATQIKYLGRLLTISTWTTKDFDKLTKEDLIEIIGKNLTSNRYSESSAKTMRVVIKRFFQWLKGSNRREYPIEVSWIRTTGNKNLKKHKNPEDMLDDEDIGKMINAVQHPRNKAFIITLAESGCRIGEILTLTIKKICFDDKGSYFLVDGKTGTRRVRVVNATPYLHAWLSIHPNKNEPDAPLWVNIGTTRNIGGTNGRKY